MESAPRLRYEDMVPADMQEATHRHAERRLTVVSLAVGIVLIVALSVASQFVGFGLLIAIVPVTAIAALIVVYPIVGMYVILVCAVLIEQEPIAYPIFTDRLNVFYWPANLSGLVERPIGFLMLFTLLVIVCRNFATRRPLLRGGAFILPFLAFLFAVVIGILHGLTSGGDSKIIVLEIRPFEYLFMSYLLAVNLVSTKRHVRIFLWIVILAAGIKALQGCYILFVDLHGSANGSNEIMAHEDSFFFVSLFLLLLLFALHVRYRFQLLVALVAVPPVLLALISNNRRADYVAFMAAAAAAWLLLIVIRPRSRGKLITGFALCGTLALAYVLIFSHVGGALGAPARGIVNTISPASTDQRDILSNLYRTIENYDLNTTERANPILGYGFGKPFLQPVALPDITVLDPYYLYIPHNTILWIWMRLGPIGYLALWCLIGTVIVRACLTARQLRDPFLQLIAIYTVGITIMEVMLAYADYQLFFYRNVIYFGLLVGLLALLPAMDARGEPVAKRSPHVVVSRPIRPSAHRQAEMVPA
jgi:hypothetical protein